MWLHRVLFCDLYVLLCDRMRNHAGQLRSITRVCVRAKELKSDRFKSSLLHGFIKTRHGSAVTLEILRPNQPSSLFTPPKSQYRCS